MYFLWEKELQLISRGAQRNYKPEHSPAYVPSASKRSDAPLFLWSQQLNHARGCAVMSHILPSYPSYKQAAAV